MKAAALPSLPYNGVQTRTAWWVEFPVALGVRSGAEFETRCTCACESSLAILHCLLEIQKINLGSSLPLVLFSFFL